MGHSGGSTSCRGELHEYRTIDGSHHVRANIGQPLGFVAPLDELAFAAGTANGIGRLDVGGSFELISPVDQDRPGYRCNDGKCDREGHLWAGTVSDAVRKDGKLFRVGSGWRVAQVREGMQLPNGFAWSTDSAVMCLADTDARTIEFWEYDKQDALLGQLLTNIAVPPSLGKPDGVTVDAEDCFWVAFWGGGRVRRYSKAGEFVSEVEVPAPLTAGCTFGGDRLDQLFITTASRRMSTEELSRWPLSGSIFKLDAGVQGILPDPYRP